MTAVSTDHAVRPSDPRRPLRVVARAWIYTAIAGQLVFVVYMIVHYGGAALSGRPEEWSPTATIGFRPGDIAGNAQFLIHIAVGAALTFGAILQLSADLRRRLPVFHRWTGRAVLLTAILVSLGGLWLTWARGAVSTMGTGVSVSANAILILAFAALAWRAARARRFSDHRAWALRTFVVLNGVWFFRVGAALWVLLNGGEEVGFGDNFDGPFVIWWHWGSVLVPWAILEMFLAAERRPGTPFAWTTTGLIATGTLATGIGSALAAWFLWVPFIF